MDKSICQMHKCKKNDNQDQHRWVCVCGSDTDSDGLLIELFLLTNAWTSIIIESNGFIYMIVFQMHVWRCSFRSSSEQLQDQFSHRDSDWPRFLYDSLSLCEHTTTVYSDSNNVQHLQSGLHWWSEWNHC